MPDQTPATSFEQERQTRDIRATDAEIDSLVHALYELTPEEVKIVEGVREGWTPKMTVAD